MPAGWETQIAFAAESDRLRMAPHVHLHYRTADGTHATASPDDWPTTLASTATTSTPDLTPWRRSSAAADV